MANKATTAAATAAVKSPLKFVEVLSQARSWKLNSFFTLGSGARVDNLVFNLHATVTVTILSICMVFVGMKQYFGEPIECLNTLHANTGYTLSHAQLQHYCWMEGAFTVANRYTGDESGSNHEMTGQDNAYPGVKNYKPHKGDSKVLHKYYQWVYYILCIQCLLFYTPKYIWRIREGGRLRDLINKVSKKNILQYEGLDRYQIVQDTLDVILTAHQYFSWILFSEVLFLIHLICEIFFIHAFLGGKFLLLGFQWINYSLYSDDNNHDPLIRLFPRLTKCSFHKFGVTGSIETYDTLCFMPLNIVNEKIFVILWFWFLILFFITLYHLFVYRAAFIMVPWVRKRSLQSLSPATDKGFIKKISKSPSRCFVVQLIASNMKPYASRDLFHQVLEDHFNSKTYHLESRVSIKNFIKGDKVPESSLEMQTLKPAPPKPSPPGFKDKSPDSGCDNGTCSTSTTAPIDDGWESIVKSAPDPWGWNSTDVAVSDKTESKDTDDNTVWEVKW